jgi:hypothetical protein
MFDHVVESLQVLELVCRFHGVTPSSIGKQPDAHREQSSFNSFRVPLPHSPLSWPSQTYFLLLIRDFQPKATPSFLLRGKAPERKAKPTA